MTYNVEIKVKPTDVLPDVFDWLENNNLYFFTDWSFTRLESVNDCDYTFKFKRSEDATIFALRWL
jgi:hypothetical protein